MILSKSEIEEFNRKYHNKETDAFNNYINSVRKQLETLHHAWQEITKDKDNNIIKDNDYSLSDMITISLEFFACFDKDIYTNLLKILNDDSVKLNFSEPSAENRGNNCGIKDWRRFINLNPTNNVFGLTTVCHEFAHLTSQRMQEKKMPKSEYIGEVESMFIEKVFAKYLLDKKIISEEEYDAVNISLIKSVSNRLEAVFQENDILNFLKGDILTEEKLAEGEKLLKNSPNKDAILNRIQSIAKGTIKSDVDFRYIIGEVVSELLFEEYKKEPQKTTAKFKEYLKHNADIDPQSMVVELIGKSPEETVSDYLALFRELSDIEQ